MINIILPLISKSGGKTEKKRGKGENKKEKREKEQIKHIQKD